jgi:hypothetical protein
MRCVDPEHPTDEYLLARIRIECEQCGIPFEYQIMGHHIPAVLRALQKALEMYPQLCKETVTEVPEGTTLVLPPEGGGRTM